MVGVAPSVAAREIRVGPIEGEHVINAFARVGGLHRPSSEQASYAQAEVVRFRRSKVVRQQLDLPRVRLCPHRSQDLLWCFIEVCGIPSHEGSVVGVRRKPFEIDSVRRMLQRLLLLRREVVDGSVVEDPPPAIHRGIPRLVDLVGKAEPWLKCA